MAWAGSSPRGRGTPGRRRPAAPGARFIPARAGNAGEWTLSSATPTVHPRAGGERNESLFPLPDEIGSSPRGRGTHHEDRDRRPVGRFIPARAGNASRLNSKTSQGTVHPRAGGERASHSACDAADHGSSPRGRGTHQGRSSCSGRARFIPARAGNAPMPFTSLRSPPVHPRAGGERSRTFSKYRHTAGSSPRGRGTHDRLLCRRQRRRFIPARAGNATRTASTPA